MTHAQYPTNDQRKHPAFCKVYARRTPMIPFHNGQSVYRFGRPGGPVTIESSPCLGCGRHQDGTRSWARRIVVGAS